MVQKKLNDVLLICHDENLSKSMGSTLRMQGYQLWNTKSGLKAIQMVENQDFNIILVIDNFEDMPGVEVISMIRNDNEKDKLPILYITSTQDEAELKDEATMAVNFGANGCFANSSNINPLLKKMRAILQAMEQKRKNDLKAS